MRPGPVLETARLILRPYAIGDFADCAALWGDPATLAFIGTGQALGEEEAWSRVLRYIGHWHAMGYGYWVVRTKADGRFVGDVGLQDLRRAMTPSLDGRPEAGWVLAGWAQGRGFAREAVVAALDWADGALAVPETVCIIRPGHYRSVRLAEEVGYRRTGSAVHHGTPTDIFARPRGFQHAASIPTS